MKRLFQKKTGLIIAGVGGALAVILVLVFFFASPKQEEQPVDSAPSATESTASDPDDIVVDTPDDVSNDNDQVNENGDIIPGNGGLTIDTSNIGNGGNSTGEKAEEPAKPDNPVIKPEPDDTGSGGSIDIGNPGNQAVYLCGSANHNCENAEYHKGLLEREKAGCPTCGSHSCISFYAVDIWGYTIYDPKICPKYDIHSDAGEYCQNCHRKCGDGRNGSCVTFNIDIDCPNCGKHVTAWTCHTCI